MLSFKEEYERYCQWEYDIIKDLPRDKKIVSSTYEEVVEKKIERIWGAGCVLLRMVKVVNGGEGVKTNKEKQEIREIYEKFKKMFKKLLTNRN